MVAQLIININILTTNIVNSSATECFNDPKLAKNIASLVFYSRKLVMIHKYSTVLVAPERELNLKGLTQSNFYYYYLLLAPINFVVLVCLSVCSDDICRLYEVLLQITIYCRVQVAY